MKLIIKEIKKEAQNANSFVFSKNDNISWKAGEFLLVTIPHDNPDDRGIMRPISISAAPSEGIVMITTRYFGKDSSTFKKKLMSLKVGDSIDVEKRDPMFQPFFNADDPDRTYIFLTAGIGITPVRSVIKEYSINNRDLKGTLLYANKDDEYIFGEELDGIVENMKSFTIQKYHGRRITKDTLEELLKHYNNPVFNISGTMKFTEQMKDILLNQLHVVNENVRVSSFGKGYDN